MKKLFPGGKLSKKGFMEFFDKKGFYIVLILCIAIVGVAAVLVTTYNMNSPGVDYDANKIIPEDDNEVSVASTESTQSSTSTGTSAADESGKKAAAQKSDTDKTSADTTKSASTTKAEGSTKVAAANTVNPSPSPAGKSSKTDTQTKPQGFTMPVFGDVTFEYAQEKLVYSKTLEDWRTHSGVDLAADKGTAVKTVADGVVSDVKNDPRFGITVIVSHSNGFKTIYSNLASDDSVSPNQRVKQGEVIGAVGDTARFESAERTHLHFEVLKDNKNVNPMDYLPKNK